MQRIVNHITLFLSNACNMSCDYCFHKKRELGYSDRKLFHKVLDILLLTEGEKSISFFGGEPLLQLPVLEYCIKRVYKDFSFINLSITTNATLLTKEVYSFLKSYNVNIVVSLDGVGETANKERKFPNGDNAWNKINKNLQDIGAIKIDMVRMTVTTENVFHLFKNVIDLYEYGFKNLFFALDYSGNWSNETIEYYQQQYKLVLKWYKKMQTQDKGLCLWNIDKIIINGKRPGSVRCKYGNNSFAIDPFGNIYACHREVLDPNTTALGNIYNWEKIRFTSEPGVLDKVCQKCSLFNRCEFCCVNIRDCLGSMTEIPDIICEINKINIIETDKVFGSVTYSKDR